MDHLRRREGDGVSVWQGLVSRLGPIGRQKLADEDRRVEQQKKDAGYHGQTMAKKAPPHHLPLRRQEIALLLRRQLLDRMGVEGLARNGVRNARLVRSNGVVRGHFMAPPPSRMRGSRAASARSDSSTPITVSTARNMRNEPARYMSWLLRAWSSIGPVVGSAITCETITAPETSSGSSDPISAMNGLSDMRSGYLRSSRPGGRPLARPVTTYCLCSSSSRLARSLRIMAAVPELMITSVGISRCWRTEWNFPQLEGWSMYGGSIRPPMEMPR